MTTQETIPAMTTRNQNSALHSRLLPASIGLLAAMLLLCTVGPALAQAPSIATDPARQKKDGPTVEEWLEQARTAMTGGDFAEAARLFSIAQIYAQEAEDVEAGKVIPFYIALAHQRQADTATSEEQARNLRERAMMIYAGVLRTFPNSAAVYNNLAHLHQARGNSATALQMAGYAQQLASADDPDAESYACLHQRLSAQESATADSQADNDSQTDTTCQARLSEAPNPQPAS